MKISSVNTSSYKLVVKQFTKNTVYLTFNFEINMKFFFNINLVRFKKNPLLYLVRRSNKDYSSVF